MGIKINRIEKEFILNAVNDKKIDIHIHGNKIEITARIANVEENYIELVSARDNWDEFYAGEEIRAFFGYFGHVMTFPAKVMEISENMKISVPKSMYRNLQRKYERVPKPQNINVSFIINDQRIELNFPKSEEYEAIEDIEYSEEWDTSNISKLIESFRIKMQEDNITECIKMFRENKPKEAWEFLIATSGKILYIPTFHDGIPADGTGLHPRILTNPDFQLIIDGRHLDNIDKQELLEYLDDKKQSGIFSFLCCPILYYEYAIGYIKLESERKIPKSVLEYVYDFSRALSHSLLHNGYFKDKKYKPAQYNAEIVDISASGLLFSHTSAELKTSVMLYADIELNLKVGPRRLNINSRVMRKYPDEGVTYYGLQFMDIKPEDFRFLFDFVYGREYTQQDEIKWEGGADAPDISFDE